ncbi:MAG TPA: M3 family metallopeptidase [Gammaproteobacteria bacterium]|nr:M3 family metallopeptidase [Gammaproteobacteria bacterium]
MPNPLLEPALNTLPIFENITPEHIESAIQHILNKNKKMLNQLLENQKTHTWDNLVLPLEIMEGELEDVWCTVSHLNSVMNTAELHQVYQKMLTYLTEYHTEIKQNEKLYQAYLSIVENPSYSKLNIAQRKVIENAIRDFKLSGIELSVEKRAVFKSLSVRLSKLESTFEQNVLESTDAWSLNITDITQLKGLPPDVLEKARLSAKNKAKTGWLLTLEYPCYIAVMTYAEDREVRKTFYTAYVTRASAVVSSVDGEKWDNTPVMRAIMKVRADLSTLLGFENYAEYALQTRMLKKTTDVMHFLEELIARLKKVAFDNLNELKAFALKNCQLDTLEVWDMAYVSEKMLHDKYAISEEILKQYFPEEKTIQGLFAIVNKLYGVYVKEVESFNKWHLDVRLFAVYDESNTLLGHFYTDLYARQNKRGGAWISGCKTRMQYPDGQRQLPAVYLVANFSSTQTGGSVLLTHEEVITLFHEFGHCLHYLLTTVDYPSISGGNGVSWDAIELPSQLLEYWCWEEEALALFSEHIQTKDPLPHDLFLKLKATKNFQIGLRLMRQLEFSLFDFVLHKTFSADLSKNMDIQKILDHVRSKTAVMPVPKFNHYQNTFSHIFGGGYAAGYYSYLWSEVLAADVFEQFTADNQVFNKDVSKKFVETILSKGGAEEFMDLFVAFCGRAPKIDALLKEYDIDRIFE